MSQVGNHSFEFPASQGVQGGTVTLFLTIPGRSLARFLASDNYGHTLERSQREINPNRVRKFLNYLTNADSRNEPFIIPPLVGNCDSNIEFVPFGNTNVGIARIPLDAEIKLFDGQHRAAGIEIFCRSSPSTLMVPMMLTMNLPLKTRQQFFSDINNNVSKPSATINMAYNGRDDIAQGMISFLTQHTVFADITDFEHNVVPLKSNMWVSFKALTDATSKFARNGNQQLEMGYIESVWEAWITLTQIDSIRHGVHHATYKRDYIQFHGVMINAFGFAVQQMMVNHSIAEITSMIEKLCATTSSAEREDFFLIDNWAGICTKASQEKLSVIANVAAQKAAANRLIQAFTKGSLETT
ncbi:DGQHR domain-containing protein [Escherichia coli]|uniref:DGQHR domain-containing protein n=1 Tax=Escherichia coli TaxID=562 RepID=UPI0017503FA5|nr:DGQHR domain-containing protein [Escherichia coli]EEZ7611320.1 DGQHR domain-containing protein [Escherichia coli]EFB4088161.1 DGQHR domain-containing protein [Escherichia coli]EFB9227476.1 DGQHR domain-containing protein [Escherichia coli]EFB9269779.1 DGQHR domain-containing protein [Escherichia coli]